MKNVKLAIYNQDSTLRICAVGKIQEVSEALHLLETTMGLIAEHSKDDDADL